MGMLEQQFRNFTVPVTGDFTHTVPEDGSVGKFFLDLLLASGHTLDAARQLSGELGAIGGERLDVPASVNSALMQASRKKAKINNCLSTRAATSGWLVHAQ